MLRCAGVAVLTGIALAAAPAAAQVIQFSFVNQSRCATADSDDSTGTQVPYDRGNAACLEGGAFDVNAFEVAAAASGSGTPAVVFSVDAGVAVDANPGSSEYEAGFAEYALTLQISGTLGNSWTLTVDQSFQGLLATVSDGDGSANAGSTGVSAALNLGPALDFGSFSARSSGSTGSQPFAATSNGVTISGTGDQTLTGTFRITLDAFSDCGGFLCLGNADEGAVLFGADDAAESVFVSADEYATWARPVAPDGYTATFTLGVEAFCGNGFTEPPEECDDHNAVSEDGCSAACLREFCGDGTLQPGLGEVCDDGNTELGDGCSPTCQLEEEVPALPSPAWWLAAASMLAGVAALGARRRQVKGAESEF
jgi:cysteine-rich repeat protein